MRLLVVTPTLGTSPWLEETRASVARCAPGAEHVLVAPEPAIATLKARFPGTRVVREPGGGMYAAINAGLGATADWEAFTYLNDDDCLVPRFAEVRAAVERAGDRGRRAVIAYGGVRLVDAAGRRLGAIPISPWPKLNRTLYAMRLEPVYQHGTIATRAVVDAVGPFDPALRFCGDSEFLGRTCARGVAFLCVTREAVAGFRLRPGQLTKNRAAMQSERQAVDAKLGLLGYGTAGERRRARLLFRCANLPIYAERVARHGFITFDQLIERAG